MDPLELQHGQRQTMQNQYTRPLASTAGKPEDHPTTTFHTELGCKSRRVNETTLHFVRLAGGPMTQHPSVPGGGSARTCDRGASCAGFDVWVWHRAVVRGQGSSRALLKFLVPVEMVDVDSKNGFVTTRNKSSVRVFSVRTCTQVRRATQSQLLNRNPGR
jgi:hypothetical protein